MEKPKRFTHEMLKDFEHDVFVHPSEGNYLHVSMRVPMDPDTLHSKLVDELRWRKRYQVGAFRVLNAGTEKAYEVLFRDPVEHGRDEPYPLSRIHLVPSDGGGTEVHIYGPRSKEPHVVYLLRTIAHALKR